MTTRSRLLTVLSAGLCVCAGVTLPARGADFVVAPGGSDANPGTQEKPFATLAKARDAVRVLKKDGMKKDVIIHIRAGQYVLDKPVVFGPADSGSDGFRVIYKNADALGSARFVGAKRATGWTRHEGKIWKKTGVKHVVTTLYEDGRRGHLARTPNRGSDPKYPNTMAPYFVAKGGSYHTLVYAEGQLDPTRWKLTDRAAVVWWTKGGKQDWGQHVTKLLSVDAEKKTLHVKGRVHRLFKITSRDRFFVMNIPALLDAPGEFYQDTARETLYYMPRGGDPNKADVRLPGPATLVALRGKTAEDAAGDIVFSGLSFEYTNCGYLENKRLCGTVDLRFTREIRIEMCRFMNTGDFAVYGHVGVHHCGILNCRIEHTGQGAILIENRRIKRREQPNVRGEFNRVYNCLIHTLGEIVVMSCHNGGVMLWNANDCRVSHCDIARNIRYGISLRGHYSSQRARDDGLNPDMGNHLSRNNVFQYIKIANVGTDSGDMGAIHAAHLNEPNGSCINTWRQIVVRGVRAHPSMKDWPPDGIFVDHPRSCQKQVFMDIDIADTQGRPFRDNRNPIQTFVNVSWKPGFDRTRMETERIGLTPEFPKEYGGKGLVDTSAPTPSTPAWEKKPHAVSSTAIVMQAAHAQDEMSHVEYRFECLTEGGHSSRWQTDRVYVDRNLAPEDRYMYRIRVRDGSRSRNQTGWSAQAGATTMAASQEPCRAWFDFENNGQDTQKRHHGQFHGRSTFAAKAKHGKAALQLDGRDGYLIVPDHNDLDIGTGSLAISLWFTREKSEKNNLRLLSKYDRNWRGYALWGGNDKVRFDVGAGKGSKRVGIVGKIPAIGQWVHVVVNVRHGGKITMHVNGKLAGEQTLSTLETAGLDSGADLTIGTGARLTWSGLIDDVRIYKRLLSEKEIVQLAEGRP